MNILVAKTKEECLAWKGVAVVIDVLCTAATACVLLAQRERFVGLCATEDIARELLAVHPSLSLFSSQPLTVPHQDNSPSLAGKLSAEQAALLIEPSLFQAVKSLPKASAVLLGGFCNFHAVSQVLTQQGKEVLIVPATLFGDGQHEEDMLCAEAFKNSLQGTDTAQNAVAAFGATVRFAEFSKHGPKTASGDLNLALGIDNLTVPVQISNSVANSYAVCTIFGQSVSAVLPESALPALDAAVPLQGETQAVSGQNPQAKTPPASKLKQFFSALIQSAKEEKEDLERSIRQAASKTQRTARRRVDDPLDTLRKQTAQPAEKKQPATPVPDSTQVPLTPTASNPVQKDAFGKRGISLGDNMEVSSAQDGIKISSTGDNQVEKDAFGKRSISLDMPGANSPAQVKNVPTPLQPSPRQRVISLDTEPLPVQGVSSSGQKKAKKAIVLFSGGLDSTTCLYWAIAQGYTCETLTIAYGQRHVRELESARKITERLGVKHHSIELNLPWLAQATSLVNRQQALPDIAVEEIPHAGIPSTYVPGRNLMFLSIAGSLLDSVGAQAIIAGPNAIDFSGYPDCTPAFFKSAGEALNRGTKQGVQEGIEVIAPLMRMGKAEIVKLAAELKVPFELTWSCYAGGEKPCGKCDSCKLRAKGFAEAGVHDSALD